MRVPRIGDRFEELAWLTQLGALATRPGPIVAVERLAEGDTAIPMERLAKERAISVNTAAAGGNASLMAMGN